MKSNWNFKFVRIMKYYINTFHFDEGPKIETSVISLYHKPYS